MKYLVQSAKFIEGYKVEIAFKDGKKGIADLGEYATRGGVFAKFADQSYFRHFTVDGGTLVWGDEVDIAPERLYEKTKVYV